MEKKLDLPFGPWKEIFSGKWGSYDVSMNENPDKLTLTIIFDKEKDKVTGMVFVLDKVYVAEGDPSRLCTVLGGYNVIFEKNYPAFKKKYFVLSSGPKYSKADNEEIASSLQEIFNVIEDQSERTSELSKSFGVDLTELKYAHEEDVEKLFSEPILLPALNIPGAGEKVASRVASKTLLGKKSTGEKAEENAQSFLSAIIVGDRNERKDMAHVILENCVLSGITAILFDNDKAYERIASPNKNFDYKLFPDIQPIGMPLKNQNISEVGIDLNMFTPEMFREIIGVISQGKDYLGKVAAELIDVALHEGSGQLKSLSDLEERVLTVKEEVKRFHIYRAIRMLKVLDTAYPNFFCGKIDLTQLISPYLKRIGTVVRIDTSKIPEEMRMAFMYAVLTSLYRKYKEELATKEIKVIALVIDGNRVASVSPENSLQKGLLETLIDCHKYGVGVCLGAENEGDINSEILENATIKLEFVSEGEVAVKETHSRPYRLKMRPNLSA